MRRPTLKQFKNQLLLDLTTEGLRIQIVDEKNRPMFDSASSELKPYTRDILREIGRGLNKVENRISLSGHTDATPYAGGDKGFGNWELSTNRANASRRELVAGGMDDSKSDAGGRPRLHRAVTTRTIPIARSTGASASSC